MVSLNAIHAHACPSAFQQVGCQGMQSCWAQQTGTLPKGLNIDAMARLLHLLTEMLLIASSYAVHAKTFSLTT